MCELVVITEYILKTELKNINFHPLNEITCVCGGAAIMDANDILKWIKRELFHYVLNLGMFDNLTKMYCSSEI